jgi:nudix-type nucleoside diphosphatase (YffH/AdpP family)
MADKDRRSPRKVEIQSKRRLVDDFFQLDEVVVAHEKFDGSMSEPKRTLVFERGDSAAALLFNPFERKVILIEQFRLPTVAKPGLRSSHGWLIETPAGIIQKDEDAEECIIREIEEETGYQVTRLTPVAGFFSSPGGSSEYIHLYYAEVRSGDRQSKGGGVARDREDIRIEEYPLNLFLQMLANREFHDPKVIIAGQWLRDRQNRRPELAKVNEVTEYGLMDATGKQTGRSIGYISGDIANVHGIDVWVNPENTDMIMDRFFGRSISAAIRYLGARKHPGTHRVQEDTIGNALKEQMGRRPFVKPAFVLHTTPGELEREPHKVRRIFHVAAAHGQIGDSTMTGDVALPVGKGVTTNLKILEDCVTNVLNEIEIASNWPPGFSVEPYRSVVFPIMGTGESGLFVAEVAERLVARAIEFFQTRQHTHLRRILFLAYSAADETILDEILQSDANRSRLALISEE